MFWKNRNHPRNFCSQSESLEAHTPSVLCTLEIHAEITDGDCLEMLMKDVH